MYENSFKIHVSILKEWYSERGLSTDNAAFVTCGLWDLATCLPAQCRYSEVAIPPMLDLATHGQFINLKFSFQRHTGKYGKVVCVQMFWIFSMFMYFLGIERYATCVGS